MNYIDVLRSIIIEECNLIKLVLFFLIRIDKLKFNIKRIKCV